jgi:hypothetical protein
MQVRSFLQLNRRPRQGQRYVTLLGVLHSNQHPLHVPCNMWRALNYRAQRSDP